MLSPWELVPLIIACDLPAWIACELPACGEAALKPLELVLNVRREALVSWASAHSTYELPAWIACELPASREAMLKPWELVLTTNGEALAAWASACSAWEGKVLSHWEIVLLA